MRKNELGNLCVKCERKTGTVLGGDGRLYCQDCQHLAPRRTKVKGYR